MDKGGIGDTPDPRTAEERLRVALHDGVELALTMSEPFARHERIHAAIDAALAVEPVPHEHDFIRTRVDGVVVEMVCACGKRPIDLFDDMSVAVEPVPVPQCEHARATPCRDRNGSCGTHLSPWATPPEPEP